MPKKNNRQAAFGTGQLLTGFYFSLSIEGMGGGTDAGFQEISGLSKELKVDEVVCGGENRFKYRLPGGATFGNLVLKRGITLDKSPLMDWCNNTLNGGLESPIRPKNVIVKLLNAGGEPCQSWTFIKAYPVKWSASDLNSEKSEVFIESIELAYQYFDTIKR